MKQTKQKRKKGWFPPRTSLIAETVMPKPLYGLPELKSKLVVKLKSHEYPPDKKISTYFYELLNKRSYLSVVLDDATLGEINKAFQKVKIAQEDERLAAANQSGYNAPLAFHNAIIRELDRHAGKLDKLKEKFAAPQHWLDRYENDLERQQFLELQALAGAKWNGRDAFLAGTNSSKYAAGPAIYQILRKRLPPDTPNRWLHNLASVICSVSPGNEASPDAIRKLLAEKVKG